MKHNAKNICKTFISSKEQNLNKTMAEFVISIVFQSLCTFWPNSILFQGLQNRFYNSILSIPHGNPVQRLHQQIGS